MGQVLRLFITTTTIALNPFDSHRNLMGEPVNTPDVLKELALLQSRLVLHQSLLGAIRQKGSSTVGERYSDGGSNYIAHPPAVRVDDSGPQNLKNPRSHFVVVRYCRFGWVPGSAGLGDFPQEVGKCCGC